MPAIVVDSSVWIDNLRQRDTSATRLLRRSSIFRRILVGDVVMLEVLQGAPNERDARILTDYLSRFPLVEMLGRDIALAAAMHDRRLRGLGVTLRGTADLVIGAYCIAHGHALLHADADFAPLERHCGLRVLTGEA